MSYDSRLSGFDKKSGKYFDANNLMNDLTNFWSESEPWSIRNCFLRFRPSFLANDGILLNTQIITIKCNNFAWTIFFLEEIFHLYSLVEHYNGFHVIENNVEKNSWHFIACKLQEFRKSDAFINVHELRSFYSKCRNVSRFEIFKFLSTFSAFRVIFPVVRIAETSALSLKMCSPWKSSFPKTSIELFDFEFSSDLYKTKRFSPLGFDSTPESIPAPIFEPKPSKSVKIF